MDRERGGVPVALVVHRTNAARGSHVRRSEVEGLDQESDRRVRAGEAESGGAGTGGGSGSPHLVSPARARPHRSATRTRGCRSLRERCGSRLVRKVRGQVIGDPAVGRTSRSLLARRRPLRRHPRHPHRQLPRNLGLPRVGDPRVQRESTLRSVHDRATRRRLAAEPDARSTHRHGVQPLQYHHERRRRDQRGVPRTVHPRPHRDRESGVDGPHGRLCGLPRPQVRSDLAARFLQHVRVLQQHHASGDGREREEHAADHSGAEERRPPATRGVDEGSRCRQGEVGGSEIVRQGRSQGVAEDGQARGLQE